MHGDSLRCTGMSCDAPVVIPRDRVQCIVYNALEWAVVHNPKPTSGALHQVPRAGTLHGQQRMDALDHATPQAAYPFIPSSPALFQLLLEMSPSCSVCLADCTNTVTLGWAVQRRHQT